MCIVHIRFKILRGFIFSLNLANLINVEAFYSRFIGSGGANKLSVVGYLDPTANGRHVEVLYQFYPTA